MRKDCYNQIINCFIEQEKRGENYICPSTDRSIVNKMLDEINDKCGINIHYIAEIDNMIIPGSGSIISKYILKIQSNSVRSFFIPQMVYDKIKNAEDLILKLYMDFKSSDEYISLPGVCDPSHIYVRFDNAFSHLKPKNIINQLVELIWNPRDLFYLPFTARLLAKWKVPEVYKIMITYSSCNSISKESVGLLGEYSNSKPDINTIRRSILFTCLDSLKYYRGVEAANILRFYCDSNDGDIKKCAEKSLLNIYKST